MQTSLPKGARNFLVMEIPRWSQWGGGEISYLLQYLHIFHFTITRLKKKRIANILNLIFYVILSMKTWLLTGINFAVGLVGTSTKSPFFGGPKRPLRTLLVMSDIYFIFIILFFLRNKKSFARLDTERNRTNFGNKFRLTAHLIL